MRKFIKGVLIFFILFAGISLFVLSNHVGGWRAYTVMSASMEPTIGTGSVVFVQETNARALQKGEIITFTSPTSGRMSVTHRILDIKVSKDVIEIKTKGDNNKTADPWKVFGGAVIGRVKYIVPFIGYGFSLLKSKIGILLLIVLPSLWVVVDEINMIIGLLRERRKKKRETFTSTLILLFFVSGVLLISPKYTTALLSDSAVLSNNAFVFRSIAPSVSPTPTPTDMLTPVPGNSLLDFPSCTDPKGTVLSSYQSGMHEIVGVGLLKGRDVVYQLSEGSKARVLQCYCPESGVGIQTNWLKTTEVEKYRNEGWPFSIESGVSWNLDEGGYVARNLEYACR